MDNNWPELETERLLLKVLDDSYASAVLDFYKRNEVFLGPWEAVRNEGFYTLDYQRETLNTELAKMNDGRMFKVWIFEKADKSLQTIIGSLALNEIVRGAFHSCFLGYKMDGTKVNQRYMTEAVKALVDYGFSKLALHRIEANIMPHNAASLKVVGKAGFVNEGLSRKYLKINGRWEDHIDMVILNEALE